jgi:hypothetical protein
MTSGASDRRRLEHADQAAQSQPEDDGVVGCGHEVVEVVEVEIVGEDELALAGIGVELIQPDGRVARTKTTHLGRARFAGLAPGHYEVDLHELDQDAWAAAGPAVALPEKEARGGGPPVWAPRPAAPPEEPFTAIEPGDCVASIALRRGHVPQTLWSSPDNEGLRTTRKNPYVLEPHDRLHVPARRSRPVAVATGMRHRFVRKAVPEVFRARFVDYDSEPRAGLEALIEIEVADGSVLEDVSTTTDGRGWVQAAIPPDATRAVVTLDPWGLAEIHAFALGHLDPADTITGVQGRLGNLGYGHGEWGVLDDRTRDALECFQEDHELPCTGEIDPNTSAKLVRVHGS